MKYYLHSTTAQNDEKIINLFMKFGYTGTGLFWAALEKIALQEKPIPEEVLKFDLRITGNEELEQIWAYLKKISLLLCQKNEIFNINLLEYAKNFNVKKEKDRIRVSQYRKNKKTINQIVMKKSSEEQKTDEISTTQENPLVNKNKINKNKIKNITLLSGEFNNDEFINVFLEFIKMREKKKKPMTDYAEKLIIQKLMKYKYIDAVSMLQNSIKNSWTDVYPLSNKTNSISNNYEQQNYNFEGSNQ